MGLGIIDVLLIVAMSVVVPFGLVVDPAAERARTPKQWRAVALCAAPAVLAVIIRSQSDSRSWMALVLTLPWLALSAVEATTRLKRWLRNGWSNGSTVDELMYLSAGLCWLTAASWLTLATLQRPILWFNTHIVLLTAVHFHMAGFATCTLARLRLRSSKTTNENRYARVGSWLILIATPTVAVGHMTIGLIQLLGGLFMACGVFALSLAASLQVQRATGQRKLLLIVSALGPIAPMALAVHYAANQVWVLHPLSYNTIAMIHGLLNVVAFILPGLAAEWTRIDAPIGRSNVAA